MILKVKAQVVAALSAFTSIVLVGWISHYFVNGAAWAIINTSLGAAAIILFAAPKSEYARPRALIGGQVVSAVIGVSAAYLISNIYLASAVAVALSILVMFNLRCLFPPAGACALMPILSEETLNTLGYQYVLTPVLLNALLICLFAWMVERWVLERNTKQKEQSLIDRGLEIDCQDVKKAIEGMNVYIDTKPEDILDIFLRSQKEAKLRHLRIRRKLKKKPSRIGRIKR